MFWSSNKKKEAAKIQNTFDQKIKNAIKFKMCHHCQKCPAVEIAFGQGVTPSITCQNCQLSAVGNQTSRMGERNLITIEIFAKQLVTALIMYQMGQTNVPPQNKKNIEISQNLQKKNLQTSEMIRQEYKMLNERTKQKLKIIKSEVDNQNNFPIFEDLIRTQNQKESISKEQIENLVKKSKVSSSGLHFIDEQALKNANDESKRKLATLKNTSIINLNSLNKLIDEINSLQID